MFLFAQVAATLPLIAALSIIAGRRGNGSLCLAGGRTLLKMGSIFAFAGVVWITVSYLVQVMPYHAGFAQMLAPLLLPAGMPWVSGMAAWLGGWLAAILALCALLPLSSDKYPLKYARMPIFLALAAAFFYFASFILLIWPFAGLPQDMSWERAFMAIWRHASRSYFMGFCPAGAFALCLLSLWRGRIAIAQLPIATRWLAFWAMAGALPGAFSSWSLTLGAVIGGSAAGNPQIQLYTLAIFTIAIGCWAFLIWKPAYMQALAWPALTLLIFKTSLPIVASVL